MQKSRLEAFSDGVFAIVITLLILDIRFPEVPYSQFGQTLLSLLPRILAYVMSFILIGLYWVVHHNSLHGMKKTDRGFLWLNFKTRLIPLANVQGSSPKERYIPNLKILYDVKNSHVMSLFFGDAHGKSIA